MNTSSRFLPLLAALAGVSFIAPVFGSVNIDYVTVGNAGNAADTADGDGGTVGVQRYGAVSYAYQIGKYEVTNAQYTAFLNAVDPGGANANDIYNASMGSNVRGGITYTSGAASGSKYTVRANMGNKPVNWVSWYDAARFTNWLGNGQGAGGTETGAYTLTGNAGMPTKNVGATVYIPSEDEWYKAAYYNPANSTYSLYPTQSNTAPTAAAADVSGNISNPGANVANYYYGADWNGLDGNVTTVGSAGASSASFYGTFDQGGNVWEWNDAIIGSYRGLRGGMWGAGGDVLQSSYRFGDVLPTESGYIGFRVARIPEPVIITHPASAAIKQWRQVIFSVTAVYGNLTYQWQKNTVDIPGENGATLTLNSVQAIDEGSYRVVVSNTAGSVTSTPATLTVYPDADGDGLTDDEEVNTYHTDPNKADSDNDGLGDLVEILTYGTNPSVADTDSDGFLDGYEVSTGKSPLDIADHPDLVAEARTAIEFTFPSAVGKSYRIEDSLDLSTWTAVESGIVGNGGQIQRFYSTRNMPKRYFRVALE